MKRLCLSLLLCLLGLGCASNGWHGESIPYPRATPFDSNEMARTYFLEGFRTGYRSVKNGVPVSQEMLTGPHERAQRLGFQAGVAEANRELAGEK